MAELLYFLSRIFHLFLFQAFWQMLVAEWWKPDSFSHLISMFQCKLTFTLSSASFVWFLWTQAHATLWGSKHDSVIILVCSRYMQKIPILDFYFFHLSFTVIYNRSRTATRHLFFEKLNHLHPCTAAWFQYAELKQTDRLPHLGDGPPQGLLLPSAAGMMG